MKELTAAMSLLLALATTLAVVAATRPDGGRQPAGDQVVAVSR